MTLMKPNLSDGGWDRWKRWERWDRWADEAPGRWFEDHSVVRLMRRPRQMMEKETAESTAESQESADEPERSAGHANHEKEKSMHAGQMISDAAVLDRARAWRVHDQPVIR